MPKIHKWTGKHRTSWYFDTYDPAGIKRRITTHSKSEAVKKRAEWQLGQGSADPHQKFEHWIRRWLADKELSSRLHDGITRQTYDLYEGSVRLHILPELGNIKMERLSARVLRDFLRRKLAAGASRSRIQHYAATLRLICQLAHEDQVIPTNYADRLAGKVLGKKRHKDPRAYTRAECKRIMAAARAADPILAPLLSMLYRAGLRTGEAIALIWGDIDWRAKEIQVRRQRNAAGPAEPPKSGRSRTVELPYVLATELRELQVMRKVVSIHDWIFVNEYGRQWHRARVASRFKPVLEAAGLPRTGTPHWLRHSFAKQHIEKGTSAIWVQQQLGHANISTTIGTYAAGARARDDGAIDRLDDSDRQRLEDLEKMK